MSGRAFALAALTAVAILTTAAPVAAGAAPAPPATPRPPDVASSWAIQMPAAVADTRDQQLSAVSCPLADLCVAVGSRVDTRLHESVPLSERWRDGAWSALATGGGGGADANAVVTGVSCMEPYPCLAVGTSHDARGHVHPLALSLTGGRWSVLDPVYRLGSGHGTAAFSAVSCVVPVSTPTCVVAGTALHGDGRTTPLVETWDTSTWTVDRLPTIGVSDTVDAVSCPTVASCVAVGLAKKASSANRVPAVWELSGGTWTGRALPLPAGAVSAGLAGVSCLEVVQPPACEAVGSEVTATATLPFAEGFAGGVWAAQPVPAPSEAHGLGLALASVSCPVAGDCEAVGADSRGAAAPFVEAWRDGTWRVQQTPKPAGRFADLAGISCHRDRSCTAVGTYRTAPPTGVQEAMILHYEGVG